MNPSSDAQVRLPDPHEAELVYRAMGYSGAVHASDVAFGAHLGGRLVGVVRLAPELEDGWVLRGLYVLPDHQRRGLGRMLLDAAVAWLGHRYACMVPYAELEGFYASAAFRPVAGPVLLQERASRYRKQGRDVLVMARGAPEQVDERFVLRPPDARLQRERVRLLELLRRALPGVESMEVGSTAVHGLLGKGDLDLLVRPEAADFHRVRTVLDTLFPRNPAQLSNDSYQGYTVPSPLDVAVQLTVRGGAWDDFLPFLDALRADPELRRAYDELKRLWHGRDMQAYRTEKGAFIRGVLGLGDDG